MGVEDINAVGEGATIDWSDEVEALDRVVPCYEEEGKCPGWDDPHYWARAEANQVARKRKVVRVRKEVTIKKEKTYPHLMPICTYLALKLGQEEYKRLLTEESARNEEQLEEKLMARIQREPGVCRNPEGEKFRAKDFDVEKLGERDLKTLIRGWESGLEIVKVENGGKARHFVVLLSLGPNYFDSRQPMVKKEETKENTGEGQLRGVEQEVINKSLDLNSFTEYFQVPGLEFGPHLPPLKVKDLVRMKRKYKKSKENAEKDRAARLSQRQEKLKRRDEKLQRRAAKRQEERQRRAEGGEAEVKRAKAKNRDPKSNHGSEKVDATILKVLGRSHKRMVPERKDKKVPKGEVAGPIWRHGMREERHEHCPGRGQKVKKWGEKTKTVEEKQPAEQPLEKQPAEQPLEKQLVEQALEEKELVEQVLEEKQPCVNVGPMEQPCFDFDVGPDLEADEGPLDNGDGAEALAWPLGPDCAGPNSGNGTAKQTLLEPTPPRQVRKNNSLYYVQILHCLLLHCKL